MTGSRKSHTVGLFIFCIIGSILSGTPSFAQFSLETQTDVRSRGMGEVATALPDNPMGFTSNPALLTETNTAFARFSLADWYPDIPYLDYDIYAGAAGFSLGRWLNFGASYRRFEYGQYIVTDEAGFPLFKINPNDNTLCAGYAAAPTPWLSAGVNAKYIFLDDFYLARRSEVISTFGFDIGLFFHDLCPFLTYADSGHDFDSAADTFGGFLKRQSLPRSRGISFGIAMQNIGPNFSYKDSQVEDPLPHKLRAGFAWRLMDTDQMGILIGTDVSRYLVGTIGTVYKNVNYHFGAEFSLDHILTLRGGYVSRVEYAPNYFTVGASVGLDRLHFDLSYIPNSDEAGVYAKTLFFGLTGEL